MKFIKNGKLILPGNETKKNILRNVFRVAALSTIIATGSHSIPSQEPEPIPSPTVSIVSKPVPKKSHYKPYKPRTMHVPTVNTGITAVPTPSISPQNFVDVLPVEPKREKKTIVIQHETLLNKLSRKNVSGGELKYAERGITFTGKYSIGPIRVPFSFDANFNKTGKELGLNITSLSVKGREDNDSLQKLKDKTKSLFSVSNDNDTEYIINIEKNGSVIYKQSL